jgi:hypothetical protein
MTTTKKKSTAFLLLLWIFASFEATPQEIDLYGQIQLNSIAIERLAKDFK